MRQKELRIALICYGGVSLAVYMHGVTKEVWKLARASRAFCAGEKRPAGVEGAYHDLLGELARNKGLRLRVLPDIVTGASAGGINAVFLAQALHSGQNLEGLTELWLESADVDALIDPDARMPWRYSKLWAQPLASWVLNRAGRAVSESVSPETRSEVRRKVSHLIRSRWFEPPFSGPGFARLIHDALATMAAGEPGPPLLPPGHPIDLLVTATDFHGFLAPLHLHSPPLVEESEHRLPISFRGRTPLQGGHDLADPLELTLAARATASFPGAFPPLRLSEIDPLAEASGREWSTRQAFLDRIMPVHVRRGTEEHVSLIDGSVLVNAPFAGAMGALPARPAQREVDRRFVYIDPMPEPFGYGFEPHGKRPVGFFGAILGSLSSIPREQPIRDNLELLEHRSREAARLRQIVAALRPQVEASVEKLFGRTLFLDWPNPKRLVAWRQRAQQSAAESAGYAYHGYAQAKFAGVVEQLAETIRQATPELGASLDAIVAALRSELDRRGLVSLASAGGGATAEAIGFLRAHDLRFRIRRLRLIARRLSREWEDDPTIPNEALEAARDAIYKVLALYFALEGSASLGDDFPELAARVLKEPGLVLDVLAERRDLGRIDGEAEVLLSQALAAMPQPLRQRVLLAYLGFPYYDIVTLPLARNEGLTEFEGVKIDRISPEDARSIRPGGTGATLRGTEFYNFGELFSRAYRENDYLWGRLHGAERMVDLVCSTLPDGPGQDQLIAAKRAVFRAILEEERGRLKCDPGLIEQIEREIGG